MPTPEPPLTDHETRLGKVIALCHYMASISLREDTPTMRDELNRLHASVGEALRAL